MKQQTAREATLKSELLIYAPRRNVFISKLRNQAPDYASLAYPEPIAKSISLNPNELLIEYEVTEPYTIIFVLKNHRVVWSGHVLVSRVLLESMVRELNTLFLVMWKTLPIWLDSESNLG